MKYVEIELEDGTLVGVSAASKIMLMDTEALNPERPVLWLPGLWLRDKLEGLMEDV